MKRGFKKSIALLLCLCILNTPAGVFAADSMNGGVRASADSVLAQRVGEPTPEEINDAIKEFAEAISALATDPQDVEALEEIMSRIGGLQSLAGGAISVLEMMGIIKDPTAVTLAKILSEISDIKDQLAQMDQKLDAITEQLIALAVSEEEKDRQLNARLLLSYWRDFNTNYVEPLQDDLQQYQGMIDGGIKTWWESDTHDGVRVLYADYNDKTVMTLSRKGYDEGFPETADNGETVLADKSFGIPSDLIPATSDVAFDINTYQDTLSERFVAAFIPAANEKKLDASDAFYADWNSLDDNAKMYRAQAYASDFLNTVIYHISCEIMSTSDNNQWVIGVMNKYNNYCNNLLTLDTGINALINVQYLTHGMEGEIRDAIIQICDSMIATAGFYGNFALNVACQDSMQSDDRKAALQSLWVNTINSLEDKKSTSLTGHDNFCYVAGALVECNNVKLQSDCTSKEYDGMSFQGLSKSDWKFYDDAGEEFEVPPLMGDVYSVVLYHEYVAQAEEPPEGEDPEKFTDYLHKFGVDAPDDRTSFITNLVGTQTFALSEGIPMVAKHNIGNYFETDKTYNINLGNPDKILGECFSFHDKVVADTLDSESGTINVNQTQAARAFYEEDHYYWIVDEMTFFSSVPLIDYQEHSKIVEFWWGTREEWTRYHLVSTDCSLLSVAPVGLDSLPKDSPLVLFMEKYSISGDAPQPEPVKNTIKVTPTSKKLKYSTLKKKAQTFTLKATALEEAKTTFKLASVPKKAKKYVTVSAAGRVKVKKGIPKGTYTLKVKVTAARTKNYKKTTETKKIKLTVK